MDQIWQILTTGAAHFDLFIFMLAEKVTEHMQNSYLCKAVKSFEKSGGTDNLQAKLQSGLLC